MGRPLDAEPGLRIPNMLDAAVDGAFKGLYIQGEDILQSDPNTQHVAAGLAAMECVVVQDLFLNETANYAHVFLPGSTFLEKDGTFTNAERRIQLVRKVMAPKNGYGDWEITWLLANAHGLSRCTTTIRREIMDEIARLTPTFAGVSFEQARRARLGPVAVQRQGARRHAGHAHRTASSRGKGKFVRHRIRRRPTRRPARASRCCSPPAASSASTMSARRRGAPRTSSGTRRTCSRSIRTMPRSAASATATGSSSRAAPARPRCARSITERVAPGVVYTTFHHPKTQANVVTTDYSDWATNCPEYKVTAVQVVAVERPDRVAGAV